MKDFLLHQIRRVKSKYYNHKYGRFNFGSQELNHIIDTNRKKAVDVMWWKLFNQKFPWDNPQTLNEKITWLSGASDTSLWTKYTDKYEVRRHVEELGLGHILTKCYGVWEHVEDIDFDALPQSFVLKCTHDCGSTVIIHDKDKEMRIKDITNLLNNHLSKQYGYDTVEPHYNSIKPRVIAEELLPNISGGIESHSAVDYKFWCINNKVEYVLVIYDRYLDSEGQQSAILDLYDYTWQPARQYFTSPYDKAEFKDIPKPLNYEEMIAVAEKLSTGFPVVRVDLYNVNGRVYFGELTFTSQGGRMSYFTDEFQNRVGKMIALAY